MFDEVVRLESQGNSNINQKYNYLDKQPFDGINYYRLKQTDYDGTFTYSSIITVTIENDIDIKVFPNPSSDIVNILLKRNQVAASPQILSYDRLGQSMRITLQQTKNNQFYFNTDNFVDGIYFLEISRNKVKDMIRIIVRH